MKPAVDDALVSATAKVLQFLSPDAQSKAVGLFRGGAVRSFRCESPNRSYVAEVAGSQSKNYTVKLTFVPSLDPVDRGSWFTGCSCPLGEDCKHVGAAILYWLEHFAEGSGKKAQPQSNIVKLPGLEKKTSSPAPESLTDMVASTLVRKLTRTELDYLQKIERCFKACRTRRSFSYWEARELGFDPRHSAWEPLVIWPTFPNTVLEFWGFVAYAAVHSWGGSIPGFMNGVTDFEATTKVLREWRRQESIRNWTSKLEQPLPSSRPPAVIELRLRLSLDEATIEMRRPGQEHFKTLKTNAARRLEEEIDSGESRLLAQGSFLWSLIDRRLRSYCDLNLSLKDEDADLVRRVLLTPELQAHVFTASGQPYEFASEPLRWSIQEASGPEENYGLNLVQANGAPLPSPLKTLVGRTVVCVTERTVYFGPTCPEFFADGTASIPAPALETPGGVELLRNLNVELPARIREKVRIEPMLVRIRCELVSSESSNRTEYCRIQLLATSADGVLQEYWNGSSWVEGSPNKLTFGNPNIRVRSIASRTGGIASYDRTALEGAPDLIAPLEARWDGWQGFAQLRVTKKFPEQFAAWHRSLPPGVDVELGGDLATLAGGVVAGTVRLEAAEAGIDWFDLSVILDVSETDLTPEELKLLLDARGGYVRLNGKGWRRLQFNLTDEEDQRLARLGLNPHELTSEPQRLHVLQLADPAARKFLPEEQYERVARRASELQARVTPDLPEVQAELRPYQRDGFHFLCYLTANRFGGILADDMGLGKTLQTLTWLSWLRQQAGPQAGGILVVCPKSVTDNWRRETERFTPGLRTRAWSAGELDQLPADFKSADLHILNYSQLRSVGESLAAVQWLAVILDEGQYIKNPESQTAQVARSLRSEHRLVLSGTPIENRLMDLWSLMTFAMPGILGSRAQFNRGFGAKEDAHARRRLAARVRPFLLRRTKTQVARDLPDRIEEDLVCEMEGGQEALYRAELKRAQQMLLKVQTSKELAKQRFNFLTSLLRLRQICCDPRLVLASSQAASAKLEALVEQIEPLMEEGQKVLVFSQFVGMLELIQIELARHGWPMFFLAGDTEDRGNLVERFQNATGPAVFLISLKAGGFGLNLTSAGYVFLFDPWWNPAVENQAIDRSHRIGQTQKVIAYRLLIKGTVEEKIRSLQKQKRSLVEDVLGEEKFSQSLSMEDLQFLLAD